ncbi:MAG: hypothetical protein AAGN35_04075 [Bacteroidota bacterium]
MSKPELAGRAHFLAHRAEAREETEAAARRQAAQIPLRYEVGVGEVPPDCNFIFNTARGAYHFQSGQTHCSRILTGKFYGATRRGEVWYFARSNERGFRDHLRNERLSDIWRVEFPGGQRGQFRPVIYGIPGEIHQIDISGDELLMPHTDYNQLLAYPLAELAAATDPLPFDRADFVPVPAAPYAHINSIWVNAGRSYIVAHNYFKHTGQGSELIALDRRTGEVEVAPLQAGSAHNIVRWRDQWLYCDSQNGNLVHGDRLLLETGDFLRGLSLDERFIYVGGSDLSFDQYQRRSHTSSVYILRHDGKLVCRLVFPHSGDVFEIRQLTGRDWGLSEGNG